MKYQFESENDRRLRLSTELRDVFFNVIDVVNKETEKGFKYTQLNCEVEDVKNHKGEYSGELFTIRFFDNDKRILNLAGLFATCVERVEGKPFIKESFDPAKDFPGKTFVADVIRKDSGYLEAVNFRKPHTVLNPELKNDEFFEQ